MDLKDLQIRPTVKAPSNVVVKFGRKTVVDKEPSQKQLSPRDPSMFAEEKEAAESKTNAAFVMDMRETSRINRELILAKLKKYISNSAPGDLEKVSSKEIQEKERESSKEIQEKERESSKENEKEELELELEPDVVVKKVKPKMVIE